MAKLSIYDMDGKEVEAMDLPENIFRPHVNEAVVYQAVLKYRASLRQGNASTKERGAVSGGGKKPFRQKGTGEARAGSNRSPLWRGGGDIFGPEPRDFSYTIPKKIKRAALRETINAKYISKDLCCVSEFKGKFSKTKEFAKVLSKLKLQGKTLALLDDADESVIRVSRNIPFFNIMRSVDVNAYDVLKNKKILITKSTFQSLLKRLK
ncbi:MAG: 50S ribosomal protein L4 [Candidatus Omnitrophota bacterium]